MIVLMSEQRNTILPTLYGTTSAGKTKVWSVSVVQCSDLTAYYTVTHGEEGGKMQHTTRDFTTGKNVGRRNETTPYEQAVSEARSLHQKKMDKGYALSRPSQTSSPTETRLPMLAHKFNERKHNLVWPVYVQPKLNGVRCLIERVGDTIKFYSRGNKQFKSLDHLVRPCLEVMIPGDILDGELYCHEEISFQELISLIKDESPTPEKQERCRRYVKFWNYDVVGEAGFMVRRLRLRSYNDIILPVRTEVAHSEEDVRRFHGEFVAAGYEGTMIRSGGEEPYRFQYRSPALLKYKDFEDAEFVIVGAEECVGKAAGQAKFICRTADGKNTFGVRCKGTDESRRAQWENHRAYLGKKLTVRYQYLSDDGVPIFPVGLGVRDYE